MVSKMLSLLLFALVPQYTVSSNSCSHRSPRHSPAANTEDAFITGAFGVPDGRTRRQAVLNSATNAQTGSEPLRILIHYDANFHSEANSNAEELKQLMQDAVAYWESALYVLHASSAFWLPRACNTEQVRFVRSPVSGAFLHYCKDGCPSITYCGHIPVPESHLDWCRMLDENSTTLMHTANRGLGIRKPYNYVLYVSANPTIRCGSQGSQTLAYSAHCQLDGLTDRPLAGYINLCPGRLSGHFAMRAEAQYTARHELTHALGLTATLFAFMRTNSGTPRTPRHPLTNLPTLGMLGNEDSASSGIYMWSTDTVVQVIEPWRSARGLFNLTRHYLVTPRIVPKVRAHFNCTSLPGLPLENQGEIGSALAHWEKRLFESELMTAAYTGSTVVSDFTLAFLEDTGWYRANYSLSESLTWGRGLGCHFATGSCYDWMKSRPNSSLSDASVGGSGNGAPFCAEVPRYRSGVATMLHTGCSSPDLLSRQYCNLDAYKWDLPPEYQYFSSSEPATLLGPPAPLGTTQVPWSRYGGMSLFADYCPYPQAYSTYVSPSSVSNRDAITDRTSECRQPLNQPTDVENPSLEAYGVDSVCLHQPEHFHLRFCGSLLMATTYGSGCYRVRCPSASAPGLAVVLLGGAGRNSEFTCPLFGGRVDFSLAGNYSLYYGSLVCPPCARLCGWDACKRTNMNILLSHPPPPSLSKYTKEPCTPYLRVMLNAAGSTTISSLLFALTSGAINYRTMSLSL